MAFLNPLIKQSDEDHAIELRLAEQQINMMWKEYLSSFSRKSQIILVNNLLISHASIEHELEGLVRIEFAQLNKIAVKDGSLVNELFKFGHDERLERLKKLEYQLCYASSKYEYVQELVLHLSAILKVELDLLSTLTNDPNDSRTVINGLKEQLQLETEVVRQISNRQTFTDMFITLIKDERVVQRLTDADKKAHKLLSGMQKKLIGIMGPVDSIIDAWSDAVLKAAFKQIQASLEREELDQHEDVDFEYINGPDFVRLAEETLLIIRKNNKNGSGKKNISSETLNAFVLVFREWYNHEFLGRQEKINKIFG